MTIYLKPCKNSCCPTMTVDADRATIADDYGDSITFPVEHLNRLLVIEAKKVFDNELSSLIFIYWEDKHVQMTQEEFNELKQAYWEAIAS